MNYPRYHQVQGVNHYWFFGTLTSWVCVYLVLPVVHTSQFRLLNELEKLEVEWYTRCTVPGIDVYTHTY